MHLHTLGLGQRVAQLLERDVGVLCHQVFDEASMRGQIAGPPRTSLWRRLGMTAEPDDRAHRSPVAADTWKRAAAARPHNPSSM